MPRSNICASNQTASGTDQPVHDPAADWLCMIYKCDASATCANCKCDNAGAVVDDLTRRRFGTRLKRRNWLISSIRYLLPQSRRIMTLITGLLVPTKRTSLSMESTVLEDVMAPELSNVLFKEKGCSLV
ncbi:unnamed protein product [Phytophthora fragariaefolia]|uniref:Unnamed protein product n=1 Tax=Phytophthora fragariaefolia TaxID=1490495 RepID=A0A9W6X582_9STRA|nr:unnamed protein product [Phytophthora fragariaefolia]